MHIFWFKFTNEHAILKYFAFLPPPPKVSGGTGNVITPVCVHARTHTCVCTSVQDNSKISPRIRMKFAEYVEFVTRTNRSDFVMSIGRTDGGA